MFNAFVLSVIFILAFPSRAFAGIRGSTNETAAVEPVTKSPSAPQAPSGVRVNIFNFVMPGLKGLKARYGNSAFDLESPTGKLIRRIPLNLRLPDESAQEGAESTKTIGEKLAEEANEIIPQAFEKKNFMHIEFFLTAEGKVMKVKARVTEITFEKAIRIILDNDFADAVAEKQFANDVEGKRLYFQTRGAEARAFLYKQKKEIDQIDFDAERYSELIEAKKREAEKEERSPDDAAPPKSTVKPATAFNKSRFALNRLAI
jgi:hypothetical protein